MNLCFAEFPKEIFELCLSFFVAVGEQQGLVVGDGAGVAEEFFELLTGDFVAAEAERGDLKTFHAEDVVHAFDDDEAVPTAEFDTCRLEYVALSFRFDICVASAIEYVTLQRNLR